MIAKFFKNKSYFFFTFLLIVFFLNFNTVQANGIFGNVSSTWNQIKSFLFGEYIVVDYDKPSSVKKTTTTNTAQSKNTGEYINTKNIVNIQSTEKNLPATYVTNNYPTTIIREIIEKNRGGDGNIDTSMFVLKSLYDNQINRTFDSLGDSINNSINDLSDTFAVLLDTATLNVSGNATIGGTITFSGIAGSTQCLQANSSGVISGTGAACGAGGGGLTIGTTAIASGTAGRILFEGAGNVLQQAAGLTWNNTDASLVLATSSTTAANKALNISQTGATTGTDYAGYFSNTGAATTNVGLYATATGATNNYAAIFENGNVGIGTTAPVATLDVRGPITVLRDITGTGLLTDRYTSLDSLTAAFQINAGVQYGMAYSATGNNNFTMWQEYIKTRSTDGNTASIVQNGDELGRFNFYGDDGVGIESEGARITIAVDGTPGVDDMPGRIVLSTTPDGSSEAIERMRITNAGNVGIGTITPEARLDISGTDIGVNYTTPFGQVIKNVQKISNSITIDPATEFATGLLVGPNMNIASGTVSGTQISGIIMNGGTGLADGATYDSTSPIMGVYGATSLLGTGSVDTGVGGTFSVIRSNSGVVTNMRGINVQNANFFGLGTIADVRGINIQQPVHAAGSTMTNIYGLYIENQTPGAGTVTNTPFGIYQAGSANYNYFAGNTGIGATSPSAKLQVVDNVTGFSSSNAVAKISGTAGAYGLIVETAGVAQFSARSTSHTDRELRFQLYSDGNAYFSNALFSGSAAANLIIATGEDSGTNTGEIRISPGGSQSAVFANNGNVGIGDDSPDYGLDVSTDINTDDCYREAGAQVAGTCASDERLKQNIESLDGSLDIILALNPVSFEWKEGIDENNGIRYVAGRQVGLIAQEVQEILPGLVKEKNGFLTVQYNLEMQMLIISAIKEMDLKINNIANVEEENTWRGAIVSWFASATNGIGDFFANRVRTQEICVEDEVGETCINRTQLDNLLNNANSNNNTTTYTPPPAPSPDPAPEQVPDLLPPPDPILDVDPEPETNSILEPAL